MNIQARPTPAKEISDFINGQRDCREGVAHAAGKSAAYDRGYNAEYQLQEMRSYKNASDR